MDSAVRAHSRAAGGEPHTVSAAGRADITLGFAHVAYRRRTPRARNAGLEVRGALAGGSKARRARRTCSSSPACGAIICWRAPRLRFVQSLSAGTDQYDRALFQAQGVRLASGQGVNERAVAEHAMGLILALTRQIHLARDNQARRHWRRMIGDLAIREDELGGKTLAIVGFGRIGQRLAGLARAFGMRVIGVRRSAGDMPGVADRFSRMSASRAFAAGRYRRARHAPSRPRPKASSTPRRSGP